jgi:hypothetical protein
MNTRILLALFLFALAFSPVAARPSGGRQYYSAWKKHASRPYYYRYYYYKKSPAAREYSYHYGIYYPSRGKRVYMYNPHKRKYWGYWDADRYSLLPAEKRRESIDDIAAEAFPPLGAAPRVPEADDGVLMVPPPSDFPPNPK